MGYHIDLSKISIQDFKDSLLNRYLIPSQELLRENADENFEKLESAGVNTMHDLQQAIKTQKKVEVFAGKSGVSIDYLTILRREVNSYHPKPKSLKDFPGANMEAVDKLAEMGIKTTLQLFDHILTPESRADLASKTGIAPGDIDDLTAFTDLVRIKWVGLVFARMILDAGYGSSYKVSQADPMEFYDKLMEINKDKKYTKSNFAYHDIELCVKVAGDVPPDITY